MADIPQSAPRTPYPAEEPRASLLSNILAIVGFIILIVVVIWGLVHLAGISRTWLSSLFGGGASAIEVSAPERAVSGVPFDVSWKYNEPVEGTYAFLYQCRSGLQFQTPGPSGNMSIPCGAAFTLASATKEISLTPFLGSDGALDVPVSIVFMPNATSTDSTSSPQAGAGQAAQQAQGSATVTIPPAEAPAPAPAPEPPAPTPSPVPAPPPVARTPADLSVRIVSVTSDGYGNGAAVFDIANVGGSSSGAYHFSASLPTRSGYAYTSPAQSPLAPGSHIVSTLRFSQAVSGVFTVSITTPDANQSNNYASQFLNAPYYNYNDAYNYLPTGQAGNYPYSPYGAMPYQTQYSSAYYPYSSYGQYPYAYQPYSPQYYGGEYYQQSPYSAYYPYAY